MTLSNILKLVKKYFYNKTEIDNKLKTPLSFPSKDKISISLNIGQNYYTPTKNGWLQVTHHGLNFQVHNGIGMGTIMAYYPISNLQNNTYSMYIPCLKDVKVSIYIDSKETAYFFPCQCS